jgi:hypothetical protein
MRYISDRVAEKIKTHILYSIIFFSKNCADFEIMWKNMMVSDMPQMTIGCREDMIWVPGN